MKCGFGDKHAKHIAEIRCSSMVDKAKPVYVSQTSLSQCGVAALRVRANPKRDTECVRKDRCGPLRLGVVAKNRKEWLTSMVAWSYSTART